MVPNYEIYRSSTANGTRRRASSSIATRSTRRSRLHYFVWLILGGPHPVLVDTGFLDDDAEKRGIRNYVRPSTVVRKSPA